MRILAAHQPQYLPWLGYFEKLDRADVFVLLDNVQFTKNEWQNRNRIRTADGWQWLTVPVLHRFPQTIAEVEIDPRARWQRKHRAALEQNYRKAPFFDALMPHLARVLKQDWSRLAPLNALLIQRLAEHLGIETEIQSSSQFAVSDEPSERLAELCVRLGADAYLSGSGGRDYLRLLPFDEAGVEVIFQDYAHPEYPQPYEEFESHLSVVDLLMNMGSDSLAILRSGRLGPDSTVGGSSE